MIEEVGEDIYNGVWKVRVDFDDVTNFYMVKIFLVFNNRGVVNWVENLKDSMIVNFVIGVKLFILIVNFREKNVGNWVVFKIILWEKEISNRKLILVLLRVDRVSEAKNVIYDYNAIGKVVNNMFHEKSKSGKI